MKNSELTLEHALYALALLIGLGLRFLHLGQLPLSDGEAEWALQALQVGRGLKPALGTDIAYVHLTAILFFLFGATNFLARFWPAFAGSVLILAPWPLRHRLGRTPALLLAFGLAIDPGLAAISRQAGGAMLAVTCIVFAGLMAWEKRPAPAGIFAGLALLSGPSAWFGLFGLLLAWAVITAFGGQAGAEAEPDGQETAPAPAGFGKGAYWTALGWGLGTLLLVGSLFLLSPRGLSSPFLSLVEFGRGWWIPSGMLFWRPLLALPTYEMLPLAFGIAALVRGIVKKNMPYMGLGVWMLAALLLIWIYPGRQAESLVWAILPLWVLASLELANHFDFHGHNPWELAAVVTTVLALVIFGWLNLAALTTMDLASQQAQLRVYMLIGVALLLVISLLLVGTGWSTAVARLGGVWGGGVALTAFTIALATGAAGIRQPQTVELWQTARYPAHAHLISKVADEISLLNTGVRAELPLTIVGLDSPALRWMFRDWQVQEIGALPAAVTPELVITPENMPLNLIEGYHGEALVLRETPNWTGLTGADWLKWLLYRQAPLTKDKVILWVRNDLMLDIPPLPSAP